MTLIERVRALSDLAAVDVCEQLAAATIKDVSIPDALGELPPTVDTQGLEEVLDERYFQTLPPALSIDLARAMLETAAQRDAVAPKLAAILDARQDTKQFAMEVLSLGAALSMVIVAATSTFGAQGYGKEALSPELADKLGRWIDSLKPWFKTPGGSAS